MSCDIWTRGVPNFFARSQRHSAENKFMINFFLCQQFKFNKFIPLTYAAAPKFSDKISFQICYVNILHKMPFSSNNSFVARSHQLLAETASLGVARLDSQLFWKRNSARETLGSARSQWLSARNEPFIWFIFSFKIKQLKTITWILCIDVNRIWTLSAIIFLELQRWKLLLQFPKVCPTELWLQTIWRQPHRCETFSFSQHRHLTCACSPGQPPFPKDWAPQLGRSAVGTCWNHNQQQLSCEQSAGSKFCPVCLATDCPRPTAGPGAGNILNTKPITLVDSKQQQTTSIKKNANNNNEHGIIKKKRKQEQETERTRSPKNSYAHTRTKCPSNFQRWGDRQSATGEAIQMICCFCHVEWWQSLAPSLSSMITKSGSHSILKM